MAASFLEYPYICSLEKSMREKLLFQTTFIPKGAPRLVLQPANEYYCMAGVTDTYISLPCKAVGNPSPTIEWFKNDVEKINTANESAKYIISGGVLLISSSKSQQTIYASYHCIATNVYGSVRSSVTVVRPTFIEHFDTQRLDVFPLGYIGGARIECQAPVHYPKSYSYSWMTRGSSNSFVEPDHRTFISHDGTLFFSYNIESDATSYACLLSLSAVRGGHSGPFFNLFLPKVLDQRTFAPQLDNLHPQIFPEHPRAGDTVYIDCFAYGKPAPKYHWSRGNNAKLSSRVKISNYGRVLTITSVKTDDSGVYKCTAENEFGTNSAEVNLRVAALPKILWALSDRILPTNSTVYFECVSSTNEGNVEWFKNAMPIAPLLMSLEDRGRYVIRESVLSISNTRESDSGMYQCFISSDVGTVTSSAHLKIQDFAPKFATQLMPKKIFATVGSDLIIPCLFYSLPLGEVEWYDKFGKRVGYDGRRRHLDEPQNYLQIDEIMQHDEGVYVCRASNRVGISNYEVKIYVRIVPSDNDLVLTCEAETLCDSLANCPDNSFQWSANGTPITSLQQYKNLGPSVSFFKSCFNPEMYYAAKIVINKFLKKIRIYVTETASKPIVLKIPKSTLQDPENPSVTVEGLKFLFRYNIQVNNVCQLIISTNYITQIIPCSNLSIYVLLCSLLYSSLLYTNCAML
uniref:Ig-like domain-containing protein n=1 Tax=Syphacia muris TaxID=451379 RepID=A0A0N5AZJ1_9BILA